MNAFKSRVGLLCAGVCVFALLSSPILLQGDDHSVSETDRAKTVQTFDAVYGPKLKAVLATPAPTDDLELAKELIKIARDSTGDAALLSVLCDRAAELASPHAAGYSLTDEVLELLDKHAPSKGIPAFERRVEIRQRQYNSLSGEQKGKAGERLIDAQMALAKALRAGGELDKAATTCDAALRVAGTIRSPRQDEIRSELVALRADQQRPARIVQLKERLLRNANDQAAVTELLRLLVIEEDDPAAARGYAQLSTDTAWKSNIPLAAKPMSDLTENEVMTLGDWYAGLATKAAGDGGKRVSKRAKDYYERFLLLHATPDLARKRVELAMKSINVVADTKKLLTTLKPSKRRVWYDAPPKDRADRIWAHSYDNQSSLIEYDLGSKWKTLAGSAVLSSEDPTKGALLFRIVGDGKELWRSKPLVKVKKPSSENFSISIEGVKTLQLLVDCKGSADFAWTSWDNVTLDGVSGGNTPGTGSEATHENDATDRLKKALTGTTWKFTTTRQPASLTFHDDMTVTRSWTSGKGKWSISGPTTVKAQILGSPLSDRDVTMEFGQDGRQCTVSGWDEGHTRLVPAR